MTPTTGRCTYRKHFVEHGGMLCDCGNLVVGSTASGTTHVVTLLHATMADEFGITPPADRCGFTAPESVTGLPDNRCVLAAEHDGSHEHDIPRLLSRTRLQH